MHSYFDDKSKVNFNYNGDMSGDVHVTFETKKHKIESHDEHTTFVLPAEAFLRFVAYCYVMTERVSQIEDMGYEQLLTGKGKKQ